MTIRENYIDFINRPDAPQGTNAALKIVSHFGAINDVTVTGNVLRGGGYTIYAGPDRNISVSNVKITGNEVSLGAFGPLISGDHGSNFSYSNDGVITVSNKAAPTAPGPQKVTSPAVVAGPAPAPGPSKTGQYDHRLQSPGRDQRHRWKRHHQAEGRRGYRAGAWWERRITGGGGKDWMAGQGGNDAFVYESVKTRSGEDYRDEILDWGFGKDRIDLHLIDANTKVLGNQAFGWIGSKGFSGHAGELRYSPDHDGVVVSGDVNGDRKADFQIEVHGTKGCSPRATSIFRVSISLDYRIAPAARSGTG